MQAGFAGDFLSAQVYEAKAIVHLRPHGTYLGAEDIQIEKGQGVAEGEEEARRISRADLQHAGGAARVVVGGVVVGGVVVVGVVGLLLLLPPQPATIAAIITAATTPNAVRLPMKNRNS